MRKSKASILRHKKPQYKWVWTPIHGLIIDHYLTCPGGTDGCRDCPDPIDIIGMNGQRREILNKLDSKNCPVPMLDEYNRPT